MNDRDLAIDERVVHDESQVETPGNGKECQENEGSGGIEFDGARIDQRKGVRCEQE